MMRDCLLLWFLLSVFHNNLSTAELCRSQVSLPLWIQILAAFHILSLLTENYCKCCGGQHGNASRNVLLEALSTQHEAHVPGVATSGSVSTGTSTDTHRKRIENLHTLLNKTQQLKEMATSLGYVLMLPLLTSNCSVESMRVLRADPRAKTPGTVSLMGWKEGRM